MNDVVILYYRGEDIISDPQYGSLLLNRRAPEISNVDHDFVTLGSDAADENSDKSSIAFENLSSLLDGWLIYLAG